MPAAAIATSAVALAARRPGTRAACGAILIAGGLAALGVLPGSAWWWTIAPQVLVGIGLGLALSALTERALHGRSPQAVHGGWTIAARHAGVVVGLLLLTPVFTTALDRNEDRALRAGAAAVLDSSIPPLDKLGVAQDVLGDRARRPIARCRTCGVRSTIAPTTRSTGRSRSGSSSELDRAVTAAFSRPFLLAALLALAALVPIAVARRARAERMKGACRRRRLRVRRRRARRGVRRARRDVVRADAGRRSVRAAPGARDERHRRARRARAARGGGRDRLRARRLARGARPRAAERRRAGGARASRRAAHGTSSRTRCATGSSGPSTRRRARI